ncbi:MAG: glycosyltransferase, partial [Candidatus Woesearchaeota archaeon]
MKVGVVITGLGTGGAENHLLKVLPRVGFDVFVISLTDDDDTGVLLEEKGVRVYYLGLKKFNLCSVIWRFRKVLRREKPDVIDTYLIHANLFGRVFGRMFGVRKIVNSVRNDHSDLKVLNFLDRISKGLVSLYVPNSQSLVRYLVEKNKVSRSKIKVLSNAIDMKSMTTSKKYDVRKEFGFGKEDTVVVYHGRLHAQKCLDTLVRAGERLPKTYKILLIGEGSDRKRLEGIASERVVFAGKVNDKQRLYSYLSQADCYVLPSRKEGMSNSLLEAMSLGLRCVVSDIAQNTELVTDGENGFVFELGSEKSLAKVIQRAVKSKKKVGERA